MDLDALPCRSRLSFDIVEIGDDQQVRTPWSSRIGGSPYAPEGWSPPETFDDAGRPRAAIFLAQLDLEAIESWRVEHREPAVLDGVLPTTGVLQFFLPDDDTWGLTFTTSSWHGVPAPVRWIPSVDRSEAAARGTAALADGLRQSNGAPMFELPTGAGLRAAHREPVLQRPDPSNERSLLPEQTIRRSALAADEVDAVDRLHGTGGTQLGGWPYFTQDDPRPEGTSLQLLFQVDSAGPVMIGDMGVMQFFIEPEDLAARRFDRVRMSWDCA